MNPTKIRTFVSMSETERAAAQADIRELLDYAKTFDILSLKIAPALGLQSTGSLTAYANGYSQTGPARPVWLRTRLILLVGSQLAIPILSVLGDHDFILQALHDLDLPPKTSTPQPEIPSDTIPVPIDALTAADLTMESFLDDLVSLDTVLSRMIPDRNRRLPSPPNQET